MKKLLLVEPDRSLADTYTETFKNAGYKVDVSTSAAMAVSLCEKTIPDLIVLELQLQGHSGVEFLHELRSYSEWQNIPVVLHTYVPEAKLVKFNKSFKTLGIIGYAYKPATSLKQLVGIVNEHTLATV